MVVAGATLAHLRELRAASKYSCGQPSRGFRASCVIAAKICRTEVALGAIHDDNFEHCLWLRRQDPIT